MRLSTIRNADVIHVIENRRIIELGDWTSLTARETGRFRRLCEAQDTLQEANDVAMVLDGLRGTHGASRARTHDPTHAKSMTIAGREAYASFAAPAVAGTENSTQRSLANDLGSVRFLSAAALLLHAA